MDTFSEIKIHIARADRNFLRSYKIRCETRVINIMTKTIELSIDNFRLVQVRDQYASLPRDLRIRVIPMANMPVRPMPQENPASSTGAYCRHMAP